MKFLFKLLAFTFLLSCTESALTNKKADNQKAIDVPSTGLFGGYGQTYVGDAQSQAVAESVQDEVEETLGAEFKTFEVVAYQTQVVAGTNYNMKIQVDDGYIHVVAYKNLPYAGEEISLTNVESGKTEDDPL